MSLTEPASAPAVEPPAPQQWWAYGGSGLRGHPRAEVAEYLAVALALVVMAWWVTPGEGGRDPGRLLWGLLGMTPALLATRPWSRVPAREWLAALVLTGSAVLVALTSATGWLGAPQVGIWAYAGVVFVTIRAFCIDDQRRRAVVIAVAVLGLEQFSRAWLPWWGGRDPAKRMIGTFYWHNQFAAYLLAAGLGAFAVVALSPRSRARLLAAVCAPFCAAGVVLSTSRSTMALLLTGVLYLAAAATRRRDWASARRVGVLAVGSVLLVSLMASRLVFPDNGASPFEATARRASEEGLLSNGSYRLDYWDAAGAAWRDRPLLGHGFDSFAETSARYLEPGATRSPSAHNGILQAFADGGLLHGAPVSIVMVLLLTVAGRRLWRDWSGRRIASIPSTAAAVAMTPLLIHSVVDFDWFFPSLLAVTAILAAVVLGPPAPSAAPRRRAVAASAAGLLFLGCGAAVWQHDRMTSRLADVEALRRTSRADAANAAARLGNPLRDPRPWVFVLDNSVVIGRARSDDVPEATIRTAIRRTERLAEINMTLAVQRQLARYMLGDRAAAIAEVRALVGREHTVRPRLAIPLARMLSIAGEDAAAHTMLVEVIAHHVSRSNVRTAAAVWHLVHELDRLPGRVEDYRCAYAAALTLGPAPADLAVRPAGPVQDPARCRDLGLIAEDAFSPAAFRPMGDDRDLRRTEGL